MGLAGVAAAFAPHSQDSRTAEGKARSAQNSRKHGLWAINLNVLPKGQAEFDDCQNELLNQIKPQAGVQADLFRRLVQAGWSLIRLESCLVSHRRAYSRTLAEIRQLQADTMLWSTTHPVNKAVRQSELA